MGNVANTVENGVEMGSENPDPWPTRENHQLISGNAVLMVLNHPKKS
jgi:hypothetical protein